MRRTLPALFAFAALTLPASATLPPNGAAPDFTAPGAFAGKPMQFSLGKALKKGSVVLYFYPAAFTPGCTLEANQFAEAIPEFRKYGAQVIGLSADTPETLARFSKTECRSKFAVAVATPATIAAYDVKLSNSTRSNRTSYVIAPDGKIIYSYSAMDYRAHVANTLAAVKLWHGGRKMLGHSRKAAPQ